jgi:tRNA-2-methylthio-N6-dimethylallyladenosine synthase
VGWVDVVFGTHNLSRAPVLLRRARDEGPQMEILDAPEPEAGEPLLGPGAVRELPYAAWVNIQTGCDNSCAFCIVPSVRGPEVSRPLQDIVDEVALLAGRGVSEVTLLGQNVNSYGRDITRRRPLFADLLRAVGAVDGIGRIRFTSPHPKDLRPETIAAMAETPEVCEHLHLPLQSGSDAVLRAMRRGYTAARYLERLAAARAAIDDLAVTTDIIVGFPGETDDDFEDTLAVCAEAAYDSAYTFVFSPRPGTRAAAMEGAFVPADVVSERFERLKTVVDRAALSRHQARVGHEEEVLVEGVSRRNEAMLTGRTRQGKLVHFPRAGTGDPGPGALALVTVTGGHPHHLSGRLEEVTARPRHRVRIPVGSA